MKDFIDLIRNTGLEVGIDTIKCDVWKQHNPNCKGCDCELGCGKVVRLEALAFTSVVYTPTSFLDFQQMHQRILELQELIIEAKTADELKVIPII
jgi:hypothetical protein